MTTCFGPFAVVRLLMMRGGNSACIWRGTLSSLIFHKSFMSLTLAGDRSFSSCCQPVRCEFPPSVSQSAAWRLAGRNSRTSETERILKRFTALLFCLVVYTHMAIESSVARLIFLLYSITGLCLAQDWVTAG